jgi:hypothetical protein
MQPPICANHLRICRQKPVGEEMVNALRERIAWIVVPTVVSREAALEREQRVRTGVIDFTFERECPAS